MTEGHSWETSDEIGKRLLQKLLAQPKVLKMAEYCMSDMFNGLMVIPNLLAILALSGVAAKFAKDDNSPDGE